MNLIDQRLQYPKAKSYVTLALVALYFLLIIFNVAGSLLTNLLGFLYPAYKSFKAIESKHKDDDTQWLTYWTVFGFFNVLEFFSDTLLYWLPFYYLIKAVVIVVLILPQFGFGAVKLYQLILRPILLENMNKIDKFLGNVEGSGNTAKSD